RPAADLGGQGAVRRPAAVRVQAAGAGRVPGARAGLPRPVRAGAGDELGDAAPGRDRRPHPVAQAGPQAVRDQDGPLLALPRQRERKRGFTTETQRTQRMTNAEKLSFPRSAWERWLSTLRV